MSDHQFTAEQVGRALQLPTQGGPREGAPVGEYLGSLLHMVWEFGEGFDGKRPFGDSGWQWEIYEVLLRAGLIPGTLTADGWAEEFDRAAGDALITRCVDAMVAGARV